MANSNSLLKTYESKILSIENLDSQYLLIKASKANDLVFFSGQYASIEIKDEIGSCEFLYSFASSNLELDFIELCIQITTTSRATTFWKKLKEGDTLKINNIGGTELIHDYSKPIIMIAGGSGIAPFRAIIQDLFKHKKLLGSENITLVYGVKKSSAMPYKNEFLDIQKQFSKNFKAILFSELENNATVLQGNLINAVDNHHKEFDKSAEYIICGSLNMIQTVKDKLIENKVPAKQIFHEY